MLTSKSPELTIAKPGIYSKRKMKTKYIGLFVSFESRNMIISESVSKEGFVIRFYFNS